MKRILLSPLIVNVICLFGLVVFVIYAQTTIPTGVIRWPAGNGKVFVLVDNTMKIALLEGLTVDVTDINNPILRVIGTGSEGNWQRADYNITATTSSITKPPTAQFLLIFRNGLLLSHLSDYNIVDQQIRISLVPRDIVILLYTE